MVKGQDYSPFPSIASASFVLVVSSVESYDCVACLDHIIVALVWRWVLVFAFRQGYNLFLINCHNYLNHVHHYRKTRGSERLLSRDARKQLFFIYY